MVTADDKTSSQNARGLHTGVVCLCRAFALFLAIAAGRHS
jgi:hypothetical protein